MKKKHIHVHIHDSDGKFDESKHKRDKSGKFSSTGGSGTGSSEAQQRILERKRKLAAKSAKERAKNTSSGEKGPDKSHLLELSVSAKKYTGPKVTRKPSGEIHDVLTDKGWVYVESHVPMGKSERLQDVYVNPERPGVEVTVLPNDPVDKSWTYRTLREGAGTGLRPKGGKSPQELRKVLSAKSETVGAKSEASPEQQMLSHNLQTSKNLMAEVSHHETELAKKGWTPEVAAKANRHYSKMNTQVAEHEAQAKIASNPETKKAHLDQVGKLRGLMDRLAAVYNKAKATAKPSKAQLLEAKRIGATLK